MTVFIGVCVLVATAVDAVAGVAVWVGSGVPVDVAVAVAGGVVVKVGVALAVEDAEGDGVIVAVPGPVGVAVAVPVAVGVAVSVDVAVGCGVTVGTEVGTAVLVDVGVSVTTRLGGSKITCPARKAVVFRQFASSTSYTVVPLKRASENMVSPRLTVYGRQNAGGLPHGRRVGGVGGTKIVIPGITLREERQLNCTNSSTVVPYSTASDTSVSFVPTVIAIQFNGGESQGSSPWGIGVLGTAVSGVEEAGSVVGVAAGDGVSVGIGTGCWGIGVAVSVGVTTATSRVGEMTRKVSS